MLQTACLHSTQQGKKSLPNLSVWLLVRCEADVLELRKLCWFSPSCMWSWLLKRHIEGGRLHWERLMVTNCTVESPSLSSTLGGMYCMLQGHSSLVMLYNALYRCIVVTVFFRMSYLHCLVKVYTPPSLHILLPENVIWLFSHWSSQPTPHFQSEIKTFYKWITNKKMKMYCLRMSSPPRGNTWWQPQQLCVILNNILSTSNS